MGVRGEGEGETQKENYLYAKKVWTDDLKMIPDMER
jgi:hypothetical protein